MVEPVLAAEAAPSKRRSPREKFTISEGWIARGFSFEVTWPTAPEAADRVRSHFGARRFAYNWALGQVKADMDAKALDPTHESLPWNLYALRKRFNAEKPAVAPWWRESSKEAYATGIADLCRALENCSESKSGKPKGRKVELPAFKSRRKDQARVRFSTGAIRVTPDRRTVTLPVVGHVRAKEHTLSLERLVGVGKARILSATLAHVPNPAPLRATRKERRRVGRQRSRRIPGSNGQRAAKAKLVRLDRRAVHLRRDAHHQLTSWLAGTWREVVIEDLDLAGVKKSMGSPAFQRSVSDAALGAIRPQLTYKMAWRGSTLIVADRRFASSQIHHGCGCRLIEPKKLAKQLVCAVTGELVDRDINAALNLRDWPDTASCGSVGATAPKPSSPIGSGGGLGSDAGSSGAGGGDVRPLRSWEAVPGEARTDPGNRRGTPRRGAA